MRKAFTSSVYLIHDRSVLLILHKRFDAWVPVGGEIESNESPTEAARREVFEETGIEDFTFCAPSLLRSVPGLVSYEEHDAGPKGWHMNFVFFGFTKNRDLPKPCTEYSAYYWFQGDEQILLQKCPENVQTFMQKALIIAP
jgi:8-oxo-dGTP pyrophosphatase MutT (NUDIX family)